MADIKYSPYVDSPYTLKDLIQTAYSSAQRLGGPHWAAWNDPIDRQEKHSFRIESITKLKVRYSQGVPIQEKVHTFRIRIYNINMVRDYRSNYNTIIQMDTLRLDAPVKIRCGSYAKYSPKDSKEVMKKKGICGAFRFNFENVAAQNRVLYGRDMTFGIPPKKTNPAGLVGMCKHLVTTIRLLIMTDFFNMVDQDKDHYKNLKYIKTYTY